MPYDGVCNITNALELTHELYNYVVTGDAATNAGGGGCEGVFIAMAHRAGIGVLQVQQH